MAPLPMWHAALLGLVLGFILAIFADFAKICSDNLLNNLLNTLHVISFYDVDGSKNDAGCSQLLVQPSM